MRGSLSKQARKALKLYQAGVSSGQEQEVSVDILAMTLGVSPRWVRRNLRSTQNP